MAENGLNPVINKSVGSGIANFLGGAGPQVILSAISLFGAMKGGGGMMGMGSLFGGLGQNNYGQDYGRSYGQDYSRNYGQDYGRSYGQDYDQDYGQRYENRSNSSSPLSFILKMAAGFLGMKLLQGVLSKFSASKAQNQSNIPPLANTTVDNNKDNAPAKNDKLVNVNSKTSELKKWAEKAEAGQTTESFSMVGADFNKDIKENGGKNAGEIYKKAVLDVAKKDILMYDSDADGNISPQEMLDREIFDTEQYTGKKLSAEETKKIENKALKQFTLMNLDQKKGDLKITPEEYASYLSTVDAENSQGINDGKLSPDECKTVINKYIMPTAFDEASAKFKGSARANFKSFFGYDPGK